MTPKANGRASKCWSICSDRETSLFVAFGGFSGGDSSCRRKLCWDARAGSRVYMTSFVEWNLKEDLFMSLIILLNVAVLIPKRLEILYVV